MHQHGLIQQGWTINIDSAKNRLGQCRYNTKIISLSKHFINLNDSDIVKDTILHEIAHALTPGAGHGYKWRLKAKNIGCQSVNRLNSIAETPKGKYLVYCRYCDFKAHMHRKPKVNKACYHCTTKAGLHHYDDKYKLLVRVLK